MNLFNQGYFKINLNVACRDKAISVLYGTWGIALNVHVGGFSKTDL